MARPSLPDPDAERCFAPVERTAFVLGRLEGDDADATRAVWSRHLLRCPTCRADVDAIAMLGTRLGAFGRGGDWEADVGAALAAERGHRRVRRNAALSGVAAAALVVVALSVGFGRAPTERATDAVAVGDPAATHSRDRGPADAQGADPRAERARLLATQAPDGRFCAADHVGGSRHDEATTGLALLALTGEGRGAPRDPVARRSIAAAVRWLRSRQSASGRFGPASAPDIRDHAIATAALIEVSALTEDATLRTSAELGVRALRRGVEDRAPIADVADTDVQGGDWARYALARARELATGRSSAAAAPIEGVVASARRPADLGGGSLLARTLAIVDRRDRE